MKRPPNLSAAALLAALAAPAAWGQQVQRPPSTPQPTTQSVPATTPAVPANPAQRGHPPGTIPQTGPSTPTRPEPTPRPVQNTPVTPTPVRDTQGRIVPNAQPTIDGRARDPATGQEFQTAPTPRPTRPD